VSLFSVFDISMSAMSAQSVRLNTISSNLANAEVISSDPESTYKAKYPIFSTVYSDSISGAESMGVKVTDIMESTLAPQKRYSPGHPSADAEGYIYQSNVNTVDEMANMISASRSYQSSVEAMNATKQLIMRTLSLGS
jgi:flagellar basal-body rod protein FlgC